MNFAKPAQLTLVPVDLEAIAERAAEEIRSDARAREGEVIVQGSFPTIEGDEVLLRQAVSNLVRNALEACAASGKTPSIIIDGKVDHEQGLVRISVQDNGPGIQPESRDRVFRPFFTTKQQGTGLGLALVQKIIVTHNGRVAVGTSPAGGASMQISLHIGAVR